MYLSKRRVWLQLSPAAITGRFLAQTYILSPPVGRFVRARNAGSEIHKLERFQSRILRDEKYHVIDKKLRDAPENEAAYIKRLNPTLNSLLTKKRKYSRKRAPIALRNKKRKIAQ